jgi:hypothetical protein
MTAHTLNKTSIPLPTPNAVQFQNQGKHIRQNIFRTLTNTRPMHVGGTHQTSTFLRLTCKQLSSSSPHPHGTSMLVTWRRRNRGQLSVDRR